MSHRHTWPAPLDCTDLGSGVCITKVDDGYLIGNMAEVAPGEMRSVVGRIEIGPSGWTQKEGTSLDAGNLTLTPSIETWWADEHWHGFVTNGKWVPA